MAVIDAKDLDLWTRRIRASRQAREQHVPHWQEYARLHARAYQAAREGNDDALSYLPSGDMVRLGLIHRQVEQTLAQLQIEDPSIQAEAVDVRRELGREDEHQEALVGQALSQSLVDSGFVAGPEIQDMVKRDGLICGHGVVYSHWRAVTAEQDMGPLPVFEFGEDGALRQAIDDDDEPLVEPFIETITLREEVGDAYVSPLEFLFDPQAPSIGLSVWHGWERVMPLADLEADPRFTLPPGVEETEWRRTNLYGDEPGHEEVSEQGVRVVLCFDKRQRRLVAFLEQPEPNQQRKQVVDRQGVGSLTPIMAERFPVTFQGVDDSPFTAFVPIPANDWPWGVSQVLHARVPAVEADKLRTRMANLTRQIKRILVLDENSGLKAEDLRTALRQPDFSIAALKNSLGVDLDKVLKELPTPAVRPELFNGIQQAQVDVMDSAGVPEGPYSGADTATESENIRAVTGARMDRKRAIWLQTVANLAKVHLAFLAAFSEDGQMVQTVGIDGMPLVMPYGRDAFQGRFNLRAAPGGTSASVSPVQRKADLELVGLMGPRLGPNAGAMVMRQLFTRHGWTNVNALMKAVQADLRNMGVPPMMPEGMGAPGVPGMPAGAFSTPDGNQMAPSFNPQDQSNGQTIRRAVNFAE